MSDKIYPGISSFVANRPGNFNWLDNQNRPFLSCSETKKSGKRRYFDEFLQTEANSKNGVEFKITGDKPEKLTVPADHIILIIPKTISKPLFKIAVSKK